VGDSPRVALLSVTVGALVAVAILVLNVQAMPSPNNSIPVGGSPLLAFSTSADAVSGSLNWYNFSVEVASGLTLDRLTFDLRSPNGSALTPPPGSGVDVLTSNWTIEAQYPLGGVATYSPGYQAHTPLLAGDVFSLFYMGRDPTTLQGDELLVLTSPGSCEGPIT
jgi:hypothetical protein